MKIVDKNYPYPVMDRRRDDIAPFGLNWNINVRNDKTNYYFDYSFTLQNETVEKLMTEDKACFVLHIECSSTFYRKAFKIGTKEGFEGTITIHGDNLIGRVDISIFVCADSQIAEYAPEGMHTDYEGFHFELAKGDFVAVGDTHSQSFFKEYDPIKKVSSIIEFIKDDDNKTGPITVEFNANKIRALVPQKLYVSYLELKEDPCKANTISTMLVLPVLMEGLQFLKDNLQREEEDISGLRSLRWFRSVEKKLEDIQFNIRENSAYIAAQKLLEMPYERASKELTGLSAVSRDTL
jgi:hypothetical protein